MLICGYYFYGCLFEGRGATTFAGSELFGAGSDFAGGLERCGGGSDRCGGGSYFRTGSERGAGSDREGDSYFRTGGS